MTPEEKKKIEQNINNNFSELKKKLEALKSEMQSEINETEKKKKQAEIQKMEKDLADMKELIDRLSSLQEQELLALKTRLEEYKEYKQEQQDVLKVTPTTYEILKDSETYNRLLNIISSNPKEFEKIPGATPETKLEYMFLKIRNGIVLFLKNKLGDSDRIKYVIDNTIAPAFELSMMEMLKKQGNETNVGMLQKMSTISWESLISLRDGIKGFAEKFSSSYNQFSQWVNAIDYLSVHNGVLRNPNHSKVLTNPLRFQKYMNNNIFAPKDAKGNSVMFSPYSKIEGNIFEIDEDQNFGFGVTPQEKQEILNQIGNIQVVNNPKTTSLIANMVDKPEKFFGATTGLQNMANGLLDGLNAVNPVAKMFLGEDFFSEFDKSPDQRKPIFRIIDFILKLIGITGGLEGIIKRWRLNRLNLTDEKNENISQIFKKYHKLVGKGTDISITDENYKTILAEFSLTDLDKDSTTKGDYLRDVISDNVDLNLISPAVVQQTLGDGYLKKEVINVNGKQQERITIDQSKITDTQKKELIHKHIIIMKNHLEENYDDLKDFYADIHNTDDLVLCITASLYADKDDVIEGMKAKVFLPENYVSYQSNPDNSGNGNNGGGRVNHYGGNGSNGGGRVNYSGGNTNDGRDKLDSKESIDKQTVSEQWIYDQAVKYGITDKRQIAYVLSTVKGESAFKNQKEIGGENRPYGKVDSGTGKAYYGRGFIQLTHKYNYQKYTQIIKSSGKDFEDNNGNILKGSQIDLVYNPDIILQSNELAAFILMDWMKNGGPDRVEKKKLSYYINGTKADYYHARSIVNGMSSNPQKYADDALAYEKKLGRGSVDSPVESNDLLIGPHLLAHNKNEIGGLGNSIMNGFQGGNMKSKFPNMDGFVGKNTRNHPHRFNNKEDVLAYKKLHPNIKSFMFYFGANNTNNMQTNSDLTERSKWLKEVGIQPVLCTNIGADKKKTTHLQELNGKILELGKKENIPVIDFAKAYKRGDITLSSDGLHPKSYTSMTNIINTQLSQA